jgi:hypothetical protein
MRAAVVLRHLCELSVTETAEALNCTEGTVKSQTARGLAHLRELLRPHLPHGGVLPSSGLPTDPALRNDPESVDLQHADASVPTPSRGN